MFGKKMLDGTTVAFDRIPGDDGDVILRTSSTEPGTRVDILLNPVDQAQLILRLLAGRRPPTVADADALAEALHAGQPYDDRPYIWHVRDVARRVAVNGDHAVMAALLHDTVEDTGITLDGLLALGYPLDVVAAVDACTHRKPQGETYMDFIRRAAAHPLGRIVKLADNASNTAQLPYLADENRRHFLTERYAKARIVLYQNAPVPA